MKGVSDIREKCFRFFSLLQYHTVCHFLEVLELRSCGIQMQCETKILQFTIMDTDAMALVILVLCNATSEPCLLVTMSTSEDQLPPTSAQMGILLTNEEPRMGIMLDLSIELLMRISRDRQWRYDGPCTAPHPSSNTDIG